MKYLRTRHNTPKYTRNKVHVTCIYDYRSHFILDIHCLIFEVNYTVFHEQLNFIYKKNKIVFNGKASLYTTAYYFPGESSLLG